MTGQILPLSATASPRCHAAPLPRDQPSAEPLPMPCRGAQRMRCADQVQVLPRLLRPVPAISVRDSSWPSRVVLPPSRLAYSSRTLLPSWFHFHDGLNMVPTMPPFGSKVAVKVAPLSSLKVHVVPARLG